MKREMPNIVDRYAVHFVIAAVIALNFLPWFLEPFGMLLSEPAEALRLLVGRVVLAAILVGGFLAVRKYGWVSTALFFLNPTLALGWFRARSALADRLTEMTSRPSPARSTTRHTAPKPVMDTPWTPKAEVGTRMPAARHETAPAPRPVPAPKPVRSTKARHVSDLGPKRGDRFADSPIHTCKRGLFG